MDPDSFEQFQLGADVVDTASGYLKESDTVGLQFYGDRVINLDLPKTYS